MRAAKIGSRSRRAAALAWALSMLAGCSPAPHTNVILISLDTVRADHLSLYGYSARTTPFLEQLASQGALFSRAYSTSASTGPSHASLFTSLHPPAAGVLRNGIALPEQHTTLAEILGRNGFVSHGIASSFVLDGRFGFDRGFDSWDDEFDPETSTSRATDRWRGFDITQGFDRRADETTRRAIEWLHRRGQGPAPFFLFVHYFDPHAPYVPPEPHRSKFATDAPVEAENESASEGGASMLGLYDGEIAYVDDRMRALVEALDAEGLGERTLLVVTADHGEGLMQRGHAHHGLHIYEEGVRVPLLMRLPGIIQERTKLDSPISAVDLLPTVLDLLSIEAGAEGTFQGQSFAAALRTGADLDPDRPIFLTRRYYEPRVVNGVTIGGMRFAIRRGRWKYLSASAQEPAELYDLDADPGERVNLAVRSPAKAAELARLLASWEKTQAGAREAPASPSEEERRGLEALGYVE